MDQVRAEDEKWERRGKDERDSRRQQEQSLSPHETAVRLPTQVQRLQCNVAVRFGPHHAQVEAYRREARR